MSRKWIVIIAILGLTVSAVQIAASPPPYPGTLFLYPERISLKDGGFTTAERGMVYVPLIRSKKDTDVIGIEIYRFNRESTADESIPPIFNLPGGPGFPGLSSSLEETGFYEQHILPFTQISDLVVVGQRGIGSSVPNTICESPPDPPLDANITEEQAAKAFREAAAKCKAFWEEQGFDLSGFTVIEAAGDVNDVRKALGYDQIILSAGSFGSHWGMAVMRYYPDIVARALLHAMEGPDHTYDLPTGVLNSLTRMAKAAEASPKLQTLIPEGGLIAAWKTVIARAEKQPVKVSVTNPESRESQDVLFNGRRVRGMVRGYTSTVSFRRGMRTWPSDVLTLYAGDFSKAAEALIRNQSNNVYPTASFFMLDCGSGISPAREAELNADPAAEVVGRLGWWYQINCSVWESDLGNEFRKNFQTEIPTVIVHGTWDVNTPLENALELAPNFKNSLFVLVNGGSHLAFSEALEEDESFRDALMNFLKTGELSALPKEVNLPPIDWVLPGESEVQ